MPSLPGFSIFFMSFLFFYFLQQKIIIPSGIVCSAATHVCAVPLYFRGGNSIEALEEFMYNVLYHLGHCNSVRMQINSDEESF